MQLGETIATYDLGLALRGESGKFEVTSPVGEIYHVICKPNHSISNLEWAGSRTNLQPFMVRKITETVSLESGKESTPVPVRPGTPFLLESQPDDGEPLFAKGAAQVVPNTSVPNTVLSNPAEENSLGHGTAGLELVYLPADAETSHPRTWVAIIGGRGDIAMTACCVTLNELDAEIRKLHAQLDEIRVRAKKKFYSAHAAAATA
jgi:hypothetical protein